MTGKELAKELTNYVNTLCPTDQEEFVEEIVCRTHRTLQQSVFKLMLQCVDAWSRMDNYDARNEHTVKACKQIMELTNIDAVPFI